MSIRRLRIDGEQVDHEVAVSGPLCPVICGIAPSTLNATHPSFLFAASGLLLTVPCLEPAPPSKDSKKLFAFAQRQTEVYREP